ncbi:MAG: type I-B CRISPR-associated protein Cas7/Cst2/DevR [Dysgonamonadaceae bacterium]|jgi:CRISPR-associated protein Cst2|nr:type I-B CRISPR-associated protein Cas7/Cst2/DevR [Dysgonamonadaceae bacterium]
MSNLKAQGFILIDVDVVALNNAGKNTQSNFDNAVGTKRIYKDGKSYVYVSGQAWRYWWRDTLQKTFNWELSPITRESKIAFTAADPIKYADDDIFGYMKAASEEVTDEKGKVKKENVTVTRVSPLKNSVLVSVGSVRPVENWSSMARQDGDSVPYGKQEYSAIMKGMFSLDLEQSGTFATYNKTGFKNLTVAQKKQALTSDLLTEKCAVEIDDPFMKDEKGKPYKLVRLLPHIREKRISETILALKNISGGAMQTNNMGDVTPKFIVLATLNSGNHPFSHITSSSGVNDDVIDLNIDALKEVLKDYKNNIQGDVFIGRRSGFFDNKADALNEIEKEFANVKVLTINEAIDQYTEQLKNQL